MRHPNLLLTAAAACLLATACGTTQYTTSTTPGQSISVQLPGSGDEVTQHSFAGAGATGSVNYIVDGQAFSDQVATDEDLATLYIKILGYAKLGHNVSITAASDTSEGTRTDTRTFASDSEAKVAAWASKMVRKGYSVTIDYDKSSHTYNCTATKKK